MWIAEYEDDELREFEGDKENDFYDIDRDKLINFYIDDDFYNIETGIFQIEDKVFNLGYEVDGKLYKLTGRDDIKYNDLIQYKDAHNDVVMENGKRKMLGAVIDAYNFGYKQKIITEIAEFNLKLIATIPQDERLPKMNIFLRSDRELNGQLVLIIDDEVKKYHAPFNKVNGNISKGRLVHNFRR